MNFCARAGTKFLKITRKSFAQENRKDIYTFCFQGRVGNEEESFKEIIISKIIACKSRKMRKINNELNEENQKQSLRKFHNFMIDLL